METCIIPGSASKDIASDLSKETGFPIVKTDHKRFPDDEIYLRILEDVSNKHVLIVQTTYPDKNIIELFLLQNAVKEADARRITVITPYFGYSRQDKKFQNGEPISAKALAELISLNADSVIAVDPHKEYIMDFFNVPSYWCSAVPEIAKNLKDKKIDLVLAPDKGARTKADSAASIIGCESDFIEKKRVDGSNVEIKPKKLGVKGKNVAIIDDIISTGGTMAKSIQQLSDQGAEKIFVCCTHGLFAGDAVEKLMSSGCDEIISTDTVKNDFSKVKTASCIARVLSSKIF